MAIKPERVLSKKKDVHHSSHVAGGRQDAQKTGRAITERAPTGQQGNSRNRNLMKSVREGKSALWLQCVERGSVLAD